MSTTPKILPKIDALSIIDFRLKKEDLVDILIEDKRKDNEALLKELNKELEDIKSLKNKLLIDIDSECLKIVEEICSKKLVDFIVKKYLCINFKIKDLYDSIKEGYVTSLVIEIEINKKLKASQKNIVYDQGYYYSNFNFDIEKLALLKTYKAITSYSNLDKRRKVIFKTIQEIQEFNYQKYKKEVSVKLTRQILSNINNGEDIFKLINNKNNELSEGKKEKTTEKIKSTNRGVRKTTSK